MEDRNRRARGKGGAWLLAWLAAFALSACREPAQPDNPELNRAEHERVTVTMAPVGVEVHSVRGDASYQTLQWCTKPNPWKGGSTAIGHEQIDIPVRAGPQGFEASAFADHYLSRSYYADMAPCTWSLIAIRFYFSVGPRDFQATMAREDGFAPRTRTMRCFPARPPLKTIPDLCGLASVAKVREGEEFFDVVLTVQPVPGPAP